MSGFDCDSPDGQLTVAGTAMRTAAWWTDDLALLWQSGDERGRDRIIPGATGVKPYRRRRTVTTYALPMLVLGGVNSAGVAQADPWEGFQANVTALRAVTDPTGTGDGTRALVLTMPDGSTRTGSAHVSLRLGTPIRGWRSGNQVTARAILNLSLPLGALA